MYDKGDSEGSMNQKFQKRIDNNVHIGALRIQYAAATSYTKMYKNEGWVDGQIEKGTDLR